jgi:hypothetical protein
MNVTLKHSDLVTLICGIEPDHIIMDILEEKGIGCYIGGHHDYWEWNKDNLKKLTESELWGVYKKCK